MPPPVRSGQRRPAIAIGIIAVALVGLLAPLPPSLVEQWYSRGVYPPLQHGLTFALQPGAVRVARHGRVGGVWLCGRAMVVRLARSRRPARGPRGRRGATDRLHGGQLSAVPGAVGVQLPPHPAGAEARVRSGPGHAGRGADARDRSGADGERHLCRRARHGAGAGRVRPAVRDRPGPARGRAHARGPGCPSARCWVSISAGLRSTG